MNIDSYLDTGAVTMLRMKLSKLLRHWRWLGILSVVLALLAWGAFDAWQTAERIRKSPVGKIYVADTFGDDVGVIDAVKGGLLRQIPTGKLPHNFALARKSGVLFVTESGSQSVTAIDTVTDRKILQRIVGPIPEVPAHKKLGMASVSKAPSCKTCHLQRPVGTFISGIVLSPDESELWVTEMKTGRVAVVDSKSLETKRRILVETPSGTTPSNMLVHPVTGDVYVFARLMKRLRGVEGVSDFLPAYKEQAAPSPGPPHSSVVRSTHGGFEHDPSAPGDSWIVVYDPTFNVVKAQIRVEFAVPYQGVFSPDGRELYVTYRSTNKVAVIDTVNFRFARAYTTDEAPIGMVLAPDNDTLMVACFYQTPGTVVFLDRRTGELKHRLVVPSSPSLLRKHPVNGLVYLSVSGENRIVEIDPQAPKVLRIMDAGAFPVDLELVP